MMSAAGVRRLPDERGTHLLILAVPGRFSLEDFESFCGKYIERAIGIRVVRNDAIEDRYSVLVEFEDQMSTDEFYREINGWRFTSEGEVCHALFIGSVECTECTDTSEAAMAGLTELPTCPVCIGCDKFMILDHERSRCSTACRHRSCRRGCSALSRRSAGISYSCVMSRGGISSSRSGV